MDVAVFKNTKIIIYESMNILENDHVSVYKATLGEVGQQSDLSASVDEA